MIEFKEGFVKFMENCLVHPYIIIVLIALVLNAFGSLYTYFVTNLVERTRSFIKEVLETENEETKDIKKFLMENRIDENFKVNYWILNFITIIILIILVSIFYYSILTNDILVIK